MTTLLFWINIASGFFQVFVIYGQSNPKIVSIIIAAANFFVSGLLLGQKTMGAK